MKVFKLLGNFLIILSVLGLIYTFIPLINAYTDASENVIYENKMGAYIQISKINANARIITNVDPIDADIYNEALKKGVAHARGTSLPGDAGTTFLFAHSSAPPWENARYNSVFLRLNELEKGDIIVIGIEGKELKYIVMDKKEVWPDEVDYLNFTKKDGLVLQTCTPIGTSLKRLLLFAVKI